MIIPLNQRQFNTSIYISVLVQTRTPGTIKTDKSLTKCRYNKSTYIFVLPNFRARPEIG